MSVISLRDMQLLRIATHCVSQFDAPFASAIWRTTPAASRRSLERLTERQLLVGRNLLASASPDVTSPLCLWKPGEDMPCPGAISYRARSRWAQIPVQAMRVYYATDTARALFGLEPVKPPKGIQATHDLGLSAVYLHYLRRWPRVVSRCWRNESLYAHHRGRCEKVEDALLQRNGKVLLMLDFAGQYRPDRVAALLNHANLHRTPIAIY